MAKIADLGAVLRTLKIANYRNYSVGNFASQLGMWVQRIALQWLTWELTHSPTWLGIIAFADFFPNIVMAPLAGALADRLDRLRAIRFYMWISGAISMTIAVLVMNDAITMTLLLALVVANGTAMAFNYPLRLSIIHALVDREDLTSAIGVNALSFNIARIGGPALAGVIILQWGVGPALAFTAAADVLFILALHAVRLHGGSEARERRALRHIPGEIGEGFRYVWNHPGIGPLLVILLATTLFARPFNDLFAGFADDVFGRGADGLAWLTGMLGLGAFIGSIFLAQRRGVEGLTRMLVTSVLIFAVALIGFTATDIFWFACLCTALAGLSVVVVGVAEQTLLQASVDSVMRGRVLSMYGLAFMGTFPIGNLLAGTVAKVTSASTTLSITGAVLAVVAVYLATTRADLRAIE